MGCVWSSESAIGKGVRMILVEESLVIQILPYNLYFPHTKNLVKYWASRQNLFCVYVTRVTQQMVAKYSLHTGNTCRIFINSRYSGPVPRCFNSVVDRVTGQSDALSEFRNTTWRPVYVCVLLEFSECKHHPHPVNFILCNSVEEELCLHDEDTPTCMNMFV